jgi:predicted ribosome quality control (RQC) complex YloA/Tae2 family protein
MQTGEDIMASMLEDENSDQIQVNDPMRIVFRRLPTGQTVMMMMPWLPVELIKQNSAMIYYSDIITVVEPKESMIRYYDKLVERTVNEMADSDKMIEGLLEEQEQEEDDVQQQIIEEVMQSINEAKNKKLH